MARLAVNRQKQAMNSGNWCWPKTQDSTFTFDSVKRYKFKTKFQVLRGEPSCASNGPRLCSHGWMWLARGEKQWRLVKFQALRGCIMVYHGVFEALSIIDKDHLAIWSTCFKVLNWMFCTIIFSRFENWGSPGPGGGLRSRAIWCPTGAYTSKTEKLNIWKYWNRFWKDYFNNSVKHLSDGSMLRQKLPSTRTFFHPWAARNWILGVIRKPQCHL